MWQVHPMGFIAWLYSLTLPWRPDERPGRILGGRFGRIAEVARAGRSVLERAEADGDQFLWRKLIRPLLRS